MKKRRKYIITFGVGLLFVLLIVILKDIFKTNDPKTVFHILTDAFFSVGILILGFGLLIFASNGGTFDMLSYGFIKLIDVFRRDLSKVKYKTFYDYKVDKHESNKPFLYLVIVGIVFLLIAFIFLWFYYQY